MPDAFHEDEFGIHIREDKDYHNASNLMANITDQTKDRIAAFGENIDLTYVLAPNFNIGEAERIQDYCENELGVNIEWQD